MKEPYFIHIPKTAGTSIEDFGARYGLMWASKEKRTGNNLTKKKSDINWYHFPLDFYTEEGINFLTQFDLFTVVRNPISKIVSAYNCRWYNDEQTYNDDNVHQFNDKILKFMELDEQKKTDRYIPQYRYVYHNENKIVETLKFENLKDDIENFMMKYRFESKFNVHKNKSLGQKHTVENLFDNTKFRIYDYYRKDFELLNYEMI